MGSTLSHRNPRVAAAARLHRARHRKERGETLIEGPILLDEALAGGIVPKAIFALPGDSRTAAVATEAGAELLRVGEQGLMRLAGTETPRGPIAVIEIPDSGPLGDDSVLVAWGVADPGNVGTMIRTAAAFGWRYASAGESADPWSPKTLRAGAGGHFLARPLAISSIPELRDLGVRTAATVVSGGRNPADAGTGPWALLVGDESSGLPHDVISAADVTLTIPMPGGTESLNAAISAGICVYELSKAEGV